MTDLVRQSFSIESSLLERLEQLVEESQYKNRSEFIRDMIRDRLVQREWESNEEVLGTITLVYSHDYRQLSEKLTELQHHHHDDILVTTHVHLDEHRCAEVILLRGRCDRIREIADLLRQQKGVLHAALSMSSTGERLD
jgi:CopG family nickel-responsive transcriptional regulator